MLNSPKTSTSFSELQNAYDTLIAGNSHQKISESNFGLQTPTHQSKHQLSINSLFADSLSEKVIPIQQKYLDAESTHELGLDSKIKFNQSQDFPSSRTTPYNFTSQINYEEPKRISSESSEESKQKEKRAFEEQCTENSESSSLLLRTKNQFHTHSSNKLRKSVENEAILNAIDSMFRKKTSVNQETGPAKNFQSINQLFQINHSKQQSKNQQEIIVQKLNQKAILLERLKSLHIFYRMKVDEQEHQRTKNEKVFIDILHENQKIHREKINHLKKVISEEKRNEISLTKRQKTITRIESATQLSILQRAKAHKNYKILNEEILSNRQRIKEKVRHLDDLQKKERSLREEVEKNEKAELKVKKWSKQVKNLIVKGEQRVENLKKVLQRDYEYY